jgi:hypothetical protein
VGFLDREAINHFVINSSNQSFRSITFGDQSYGFIGASGLERLLRRGKRRLDLNFIFFFVYNDYFFNRI